MSGSAPALRILIVADDPLVRGGLAALLTDQPDCMVAGQLAADADVVAGLDVYRPDAVLWDFGWGPTLEPPPYPAESGREAIRTRLERLTDLRHIGQPVVALLPDTTHAAETWIAGACSLLVRDVQAGQLVRALHATVQGFVVLDTALAASLLPTRHVVPASFNDPLTPREAEVLQLLAEGLPNKTIAEQLHISEHTVKFHVNAIMGKLGAQSRTEAVVRATRQGLLLL